MKKMFFAVLFLFPLLLCYPADPADPGVLEQKLYDAIVNHDVEQLREVISLGVDVNSRIFGSISHQNNTPLAHAFYYGQQPRAKKLTPFNAEIIQILLDAGAVPQYWMLHISYFHADITKMLLDYGALTNPESSEHGDPPDYYRKPESLILHYCLKVGEILNGNWDDALSIAESVAVLLEYGLDANYRDPQSGQTPLTVALNSRPYSPDLVDSLLRYVSRPLSRNDYRNLAALNTGSYYRYWFNTGSRHGLYQTPSSWDSLWELWLSRAAEAGIDYIDYDTLVLSDIQQGILDPNTKDDDGKDFFDYAVTSGTAVFMRGLVPWLIESGRTILAVDGSANPAGLYIDAVNAGNPSVAAVLSTVMDNVFTMKEADGNEYTQGNIYSLEYYTYDHDTIYASAQRMPDRTLHQIGPGGVRFITNISGNIYYSLNRFYILFPYNEGLTLHTIQGTTLDIQELVSREWKKYNTSNPRWHLEHIFGNILYVCNPVYNAQGKLDYALVDISGEEPLVYIQEDLQEQENITYDAMNFVFDQGKAYLIKRTGEVLVFSVRQSFLQFEDRVSLQDCRIPGWNGRERVFVEDGMVKTYNFANGAVRSLGTSLNSSRSGQSYYLYQDEQDRRFVVEASNARAYPEPAEEYDYLGFFGTGYRYYDREGNKRTICFFEGVAHDAAHPEGASRPLDAQLKRKLVLSGNAIANLGISTSTMYGNKMYVSTDNALGFTIDMNTMQVSSAYNTPQYPLGGGGRRVDVFPFGNDDLVLTSAYDNR